MKSDLINLSKYNHIFPGKTYPIVDWTRKDCWDFIKKNQVHYHPMHDKNYPSIGCAHCTSPVKDGQSERDGRWVSFPLKIECGLHSHDKKQHH